MADQGVRIDSRDYHALFVAAKDFDRKLYAQVRRGLRDAAAPIVDDIKSEIGRIPSSGKHHSGVRAGLAAGTRAGILASSAKTAGVRIVTSPSKLPANKRALAKAFNKNSFRHPVFARRGLIRHRSGTKWVAQPGRPYFGATVMRHRDEVTDSLRTAYLRTAAQLPNYTGPTR